MTVVITEADLRKAMRDRRYWQAGHPEWDRYGEWVTEGWRALAAAGEGGAKEVRVRAYTRHRDGRVEHVDAYTQRRAGRKEEHVIHNAADGGGAAEAPADATPAVLTIIIGGAADGLSGAVLQELRDLRRDSPGQTIKYFPHDAYEDIREMIDNAAPGTRIQLVGHSWGGNTAARTAAALGAEGRRVDMLVTVDPVSANADRDLMVAARAGAREWINIQAVGGTAFHPDNIIARFGGRFGDLPEGFADHHIRAPVTHAQFRYMLQTPDASGRSALDALRRR